MSIYDEKKEFESVRGLTLKLREFYQEELKRFEPGRRDETVRVRTNLAMNWPGDEQVEQLLKDAFSMMMNNNVELEDIKWS